MYFKILKVFVWLFQVLICAVLSLTAALPQRRVALRPEPQQQLDDQQQAEQNYNPYQQPQQPQPDYRQQQQQQQAQEYQQQPQQQQYRQKPVEDFRPKVELDTTTFIPIIRFDKEQGTDGSYKTA